MEERPVDLLQLDYSPGIGKQVEIWKQFNLPVVFSHGMGLREFFLVLSVGRCKFRLTDLSVAHILQAVLGGDAKAFKVEDLQDRVYKFSVSCKKISFYIYNIKSYECTDFKILFHLWGNGGPQAIQEEQRWDLEQEREWTMVTKKKKMKSYAEAARSVPRHHGSRSLLSGANAIPTREATRKKSNTAIPPNPIPVNSSLIG
ncbi:hypothetical protein EJB05_56695, partial [Eragrostis curvula]